jgi:cis-3-alkyl-4-acyloxetan-2-one decarboxylase
MINIFKKIKNRHHLHIDYDSGGDGPVVIFLHGLASDSSTWDNALELEKSGKRLIAFDLLGFGRSPKPEDIDYNLKDHSKSVINTLKHHSIHTPVAIVGHSMGALIAVEVARKKPSMVSKLVLIGAPFYHRKDTFEVLYNYRKTGKIKPFNSLYYFYIKVVEKRDLTLKAAKRVMKLAPKDYSFALTAETWDPFKLSLINCVMNQDSLDYLETLQVPVTLIYGRMDGFIVTKNYAELRRIRPDFTYIKHPGGHMISKRLLPRIIEALGD